MLYCASQRLYLACQSTAILVELRRGVTKLLFKYSTEVSRVFKADFHRNLCYIHIGRFEEPHGVVQSIFSEVFVYGDIG